MTTKPDARICSLCGMAEGYLSVCEQENRELRAALEHIGNVATSAVLGLDDGIDHRWYIEEVARVLGRAKK